MLKLAQFIFGSQNIWFQKRTGNIYVQTIISSFNWKSSKHKLAQFIFEIQNLSFQKKNRENLCLNYH